MTKEKKKDIHSEDEFDDIEEEEDDESIVDEDEENESEITDEEKEDLSDINEDEVYDIECDDDIDIKEDLSIEIVPKNERISSSRMTIYEMVRILGERTKQLTMGAKLLIKVPNEYGLSYEQMAIEEFKLKMTPYKIRRPLPSGKYELWTLDELNIDHLLYYIN